MHISGTKPLSALGVTWKDFNSFRGLIHTYNKFNIVAIEVLITFISVLRKKPSLV